MRARREERTPPTAWREAATLLVASIMVSGAAIYNGYPLVHTDTRDYLTGANFGGRSIFYHLLIAPAQYTHTLWTVVAMQSLLVIYLIRLVLRHVFAIKSGLQFLVVIALVCALSNLPWCAGFIVPDIFQPMMVLGLFLLAFCYDRLSRWERGYVITLTFIGSIVHYSNPPIAIALLAAALIVRMALRRRVSDTVANLATPAIVIAAALGALVVSNYLTFGLVTYSASGYAFELYRLAKDGPAREYLSRNCSDQKYEACGYVHPGPMSPYFALWGSKSMFKKNGFIGERKEGMAIMIGTIEQYPLWVLRDALAHTISQLGHDESAVGMDTAVHSDYPTAALRSLYPDEFDSYLNSRQSRNEFANPLGLQSLDHSVLLFCVFYCLFIAAVLARDGQWLAVKLMATVGLAVLVNAFVTGAISAPVGRYENRIIWLIPLLAIASWRKALRLSDDEGARL